MSSSSCKVKKKFRLLDEVYPLVHTGVNYDTGVAPYKVNDFGDMNTNCNKRYCKSGTCWNYECVPVTGRKTKMVIPGHDLEAIGVWNLKNAAEIKAKQNAEDKGKDQRKSRRESVLTKKKKAYNDKQNTVQTAAALASLSKKTKHVRKKKTNNLSLGAPSAQESISSSSSSEEEDDSEEEEEEEDEISSVDESTFESTMESEAEEEEDNKAEMKELKALLHLYKVQIAELRKLSAVKTAQEQNLQITKLSGKLSVSEADRRQIKLLEKNRIGQIEKLRKDVETANDHANDAEKVVDELQQEIKKLKDKLKNCDTTIKGLKKDVETAKESAKKFQNERDQLKLQVETLKVNQGNQKHQIALEMKQLDVQKAKMQEMGKNERVEMQENARINVNANNVKDRREKRNEKNQTSKKRSVALERIGVGNSKLFQGNLNNQQSLMSLSTSTPPTDKKSGHSRRSRSRGSSSKRDKRKKRDKRNRRYSISPSSSSSSESRSPSRSSDKYDHDRNHKRDKHHKHDKYSRHKYTSQRKRIRKKKRSRKRRKRSQSISSSDSSSRSSSRSPSRGRSRIKIKKKATNLNVDGSQLTLTFPQAKPSNDFISKICPEPKNNNTNNPNKF